MSGSFDLIGRIDRQQAAASLVLEIRIALVYGRLMVLEKGDFRTVWGGALVEWMDGWGRNRSLVIGICSGSNGALGYRLGAKRCFGVYYQGRPIAYWARRGMLTSQHVDQ